VTFSICESSPSAEPNAGDITGQGQLGGACIVDTPAADAVTQETPSSLKAGPRGERRDAVTSLVTKCGPLREKLTLIYAYGLAVILFTAWYPLEIPGKSTVQKQYPDPQSYLTWCRGPGCPLL